MCYALALLIPKKYLVKEDEWIKGWLEARVMKSELFPWRYENCQEASNPDMAEMGVWQGFLEGMKVELSLKG